MIGPAIKLTRVLPAPVERVWAAWASAEAMSRWFKVEGGWVAKAEADFRVGGRYRVEMDRRNGVVFLAFGEYLAIVPQTQIVFSWNSAAPAVRGSVVTIDLKSVPGGTELTLTHDKLPDDEIGRNHQQGWAGVVDNLQADLSASGRGSD